MIIASTEQNVVCTLCSESPESFVSYLVKLVSPSNNNGTDYDYDDEYYEEYDYEPYDEIQANSTGITFRNKIFLIHFFFR